MDILSGVTCLPTVAHQLDGEVDANVLVVATAQHAQVILPQALGLLQVGSWLAQVQLINAKVLQTSNIARDLGVDGLNSDWSAPGNMNGILQQKQIERIHMNMINLTALSEALGKLCLASICPG